MEGERKERDTKKLERNSKMAWRKREKEKPEEIREKARRQEERGKEKQEDKKN